MNRMTLVTALSIALSPLVAFAQSANGSYISVAAGINKMEHEHVTLSVDGIPGSAVSGEVLTETGPAVAIAFGKRIGAHWRAELQADYRYDRISGEAGLVGAQNATGSETKYGLMANAYYDFSSAGLHPYVGGGIGAQLADATSLSGTNGFRTVTVEGGTRTSPAYQGIAGIAFPARFARGLTVTLEYRYMALVGERKYKGMANVVGVGSFPMTDISDSNNNHTILLGIRLPCGH